MSLTSLKLTCLVSHTSLELVPTSFSYSPPSPSIESALVKPMDHYVITDLHDDVGPVDIKTEQLNGMANEFDRFLGNYRGYNPSIDPRVLYMTIIHL